MQIKKLQNLPQLVNGLTIVVNFKMKLLILITVISLANNVKSADIRVDPLVLISQGLVRGERSANGVYSSFLGIPYAKVDLENPFGASLTHSGFGDEVFNANDGSVACPQYESNEGTLDCLRLNIYVPTKASSRNPLPVLVFIHGGGYTNGSANVGRPDAFMNQDIVVVTMNYRLGAYGFMCLGIPSVPGNQGLKDQLTALRWIRQNIAAFGGNPYSVTIAGHSAGSSSVAFHLFSAQEKLFNKAILQSGTSLSFGSHSNADKDAAIKLSEYLGFNTTDTEQALIFLTNTEPNIVTAASRELDLSLLPCKEKSFTGVENIIESDPFTLSNPNKVRNTPILIGSTSNEFTSLLSHTDILQNNRNDFIHEELKRHFNLNAEILETAVATVRQFYFGDDPISDYNSEVLDHFYSDYMFDYPVEATITQLLNENAGLIYKYVFNYVGDNDEGYKDNAQHSAEIKYLFTINSETLNEKDTLIADRITTLWANFVKHGNPTPQVSELLPVIWEPVTKDTRPYMKIDTELSLEHRWRKESMAFWDLFYIAYGQYNN